MNATTRAERFPDGDRVQLASLSENPYPISSGEIINCMIGAAKRDPEKFERPNLFDIQAPVLVALEVQGEPCCCLE